MTQEHRPADAAFAKLIETAGCMIVILREDLSIAYFNPYAEKLTGYSVAEVLGKNYVELFLKDTEVVGVLAEVRRMFRGGAATRSYENPIVCRNGSARWLEWNAEIIDDYLGEPGLLAVGHDISHRKESEEALRDREARLKAVLDTAVDGILTIDECGIVQSMNLAAERIFGFKADEVVGKNVNLLMPAPYRDEHDQYIANYLKSGVPKIIGIGREVTGLRKNGTKFPCDLAVSEVALQGRRLFTGIVRDITSQREAETRLLQSERLAAIGETVAGLAHESRNAFQRSQACLEMLELELEGRTEELQLVARIQNALDHLHHLYEEVRDYAAPIKLDRQPCNLAHVWRDAWSHLELTRQGKSIRTVESTEGVDLTCSVDWFAMGQVFRNVLENAISACPDDGVIAIYCRETTCNGNAAVEVRIRDNGPGFAPEVRHKVFDAFFTTKTKGTGLGMAIARRIVEAHEGRIVAGDSPSGAEIVITLPRL